MGQEWSWPCASRDSQEKKLAESKYDFNFLHKDDHEDDFEIKNNARLQKIAKIEKVVTAKDNITRQHSNTYSPSLADSNYTFTDDNSTTGGDWPIFVVCEEIDDFNVFLSKYRKKYGDVSFQS
jgi:hypothetical protein